MKKIGTLLLCLSFSLVSFADTINEDLAKIVASNFYWKKTGEKKAIASVTHEYYNGEASIYILNFEGGGWVLVSRNNDVDPILGYSTDGSFTEQKEERPDGLNFLMDLYGENITSERHALRSKNEEVQVMWEDLINYHGEQSESLRSYQASKSLMYDASVGKCIQWGQGDPYNRKCPVVESTHCKVGCTGTALAQLMRKWKWPSNSVVKDKNNNYYYDEYNWDLMPYTLTGKSDSEIEQVANLSWKCGLATHMTYGVNGSGAWPRTEAFGMFEYSYMQKYLRSDYSTSYWIDMLRTEVKAGRPVVYVGYKNDTTGHTFLICGHDEGSMFYLNFGWYGSSDNTLYNLSGTATGSNAEYVATNASRHQRAVIGISPKYPRLGESPYFTPSVIKSGEKRKGTKAENLIVPSGNSLTLEANSKLTLEAGKSIILRKGFIAKQGSKFSAKLNSSLYENHEIGVSYNSVTTGSSGKIILNVSNANSWYVAIKNSNSTVLSRNCGNITGSGTQAITVWTGTANTSYSYEVVFLNNYGIIKKVTGKFDSTKQNISLSDYNPTDNDAFHYINLPYNNKGNGPIEELEEKQNAAVAIYPNPSTGYFTISFGEDNKEGNSVKISDISGKVVYEADNLGQEVSLNLSDKQKGVYFVQTNSNGNVNVQKVILK